MDHYFKPVSPKDAHNGVIRNSRAHYESRRGRQTRSSTPAERAPSYLQAAKDELSQALQGNPGIEEVWDVVRKRLVESYWNGVEHGATGKVKPRTESA
jgi:hypothetical protein